MAQKKPGLPPRGYPPVSFNYNDPKWGVAVKYGRDYFQLRRATPQNQAMDSWEPVAAR